jgi:hypothetical protein
MAESGERTLAACWFRRSAETNFPQDPRESAEIANLQEKFAKAKRLRQHASRVRSPELSFACSLLFQVDAIRFLVGFLQADLNLFARRGRQIFADVIGTNRQLPMTAIDQYSKLNTRGTAK